MSTDNVDTRVVELDFDNKQFEKSAKQSISTLDKLKKSLSFDNVSDSIDEISVSFSKMEVAAITVIQNITNRITNLGINLVKSLTIDNITTGWAKFGQKTTSVATMAAQSLKVAGEELSNYTDKMAAIDKYLNQLNWFSDETSYTFTDMVDNIGKFTAAGQDLDASVKAMMGIANWAALSGQNATTAARAMYQLSQALSKGNVQLIDYKSIQNANMDTQEFRQTVLDTAVALGELTKSGDNYITKTGKKFTKNQFTEQLSEKWFTDKVLTQSLEKYSAAVEQIYSIAQETGLTASEVIEQYGDSLDEFGVKAFKAAQEARTFSDSLNSVKDAYSTAWMKTFEYIFGGYDDAKSLWTDLANELYSAVVESNNFRNEILEVWSALSGRADLMAHTGDDDQGAFWNIYDAIIAIKDIISQAWNDIFPLSLFSETSDQAQEIGTRLKSITSNLQSLSKKLKPSQETLEKLRKILNGVFSVVKFGLNLIRLSWAALQPILTIVKNLISSLATLTGKLGSGLTTVLEKLSDVLEKGVQKLWEFWDTLYDGLNLNNIVSRLSSFIDKIKSFFKTIGSAISSYISPIIETLKSGISTAKEFFSSLFSNSSNKTENVNSRVKQNKRNKNGEINREINAAYYSDSDNQSIDNSIAKDWFTKFKEDMISFANDIYKFFNTTLIPIVTSTISLIKSFWKLIGKALVDFNTKLKNFIKELAVKLTTPFNNIKETLKSSAESLVQFSKNVLYPLVEAVFGIGKSLVSFISKNIQSCKSAFDSIKSFIDDFDKNIKLLYEKIKNLFSKKESGSGADGGGGDNDTGNKKSNWFIDFFNNKVLPQLKTIYDSLKSFIDYFNEKIKGLLDKIRDLLNEKDFNWFINKLESFLDDIINVFNNVLYPIAKSIVNFATTVLSTILKSLYTILSMMASYIDDLTTKAVALIEILDISDYFYDTLSAMMAIVSSILVLCKSLATLANRILNVIADTLSLISRRLDGLAVDSGSVSDSINNLLESLINLIEGAAYAASGLIRMATSALNIFGKAFELLSDMLQRINVTFKNAVTEFQSLSKSLKITIKVFAGIFIVLAAVIVLIKLISDLVWSLTGPIKNLAQSVSAFLDSKSLTNTLRSATALINSISGMLLSFAIACSLFQTLDPTIMISTVAILFTFIGGLTLLIIVLNKYADFTVSYNKISSKIEGNLGSVSAGGVSKKQNDALNQFARFLTSISVSLLIVSVAMKKLSLISWDGIGKGLVALLGFFVILGGTMVGLMAATRLMNPIISKTEDINSTLKSLATPLLAVSVFVLSLANSLALLSAIRTGLLWNSLAIVSAFMAVVTGMFAAIIKVADSNKHVGQESLQPVFYGIASVVAAMSLLLLSLATSLTRITTLATSVGWGNVWFAFLMVTLMLGELTGVCFALAATSKVIDKENPDKSLSSIRAVLNSMSVLLLAATTSISILASISWNRALIAIGEMALVIAALSTAAVLVTKFSKNADEGSQNLVKSYLLSMSGTLLAMTAMIGILSLISWNRALIAIGEMALVIAALSTAAVLVTKFSKNADEGSSLKSFFIGISAAALAMSVAIAILAKYDWDKSLAAAGALSMIIVAFGGMSTLVSKFGKMSLIITFAASIGAATAAMSASLMLIAKYDWEKLLAAAGALSMIIVAFGGMVTLMNSFGGLSASVLLLSFGLALIEVSGAAILFATAIQKIADVNLSSIGKSLLIFAGGIVAFAAASLLVTPIIPIMLALGVSLTLLGVAMLVISKSMTSITDSLVPMCETISENIQLITDTFTTMANSIGDMIANIIINAFSNLTSMLDSVTEFVSKLFGSIITIAKDNLPELWSLITDFISKVFTYINESRGKISDLIIGMFTSLLSKIDEYGPTIVDKLFSIVNTFMTKLRDNIPTLVTTLIDIVITIIDTLTKNVGKLVNSIVKFIISLLKTMVKAVGQVMTTIITQMLNLIGLIIRLIGTSLGTLMGDLIIFIGYLLDVLVQAFRGMAKVIGQTFLTIFAIIIEAIDNTIKNATTAIKNAFKIIVADLYGLFLDAVEATLGGLSVVKNWVNEQRDKMEEYSRDARDWMSYMSSGKNIQEAAKNAANSINEATSTLNKNIAENTKNGIDAINDAFNDFLNNQDTEVTITPVIDDSELDAISNNLDKELDYSGTTSAANATNDAVSGSTTSKTVNNETTYNNNNTYTSTFNISGNYDPNEIADIVDQRMQTNAQTGRLTKGTA